MLPAYIIAPYRLKLLLRTPAGEYVDPAAEAVAAGYGAAAGLSSGVAQAGGGNMRGGGGIGSGGAGGGGAGGTVGASSAGLAWRSGVLVNALRDHLPSPEAHASQAAALSASLAAARDGAVGKAGPSGTSAAMSAMLTDARALVAAASCWCVHPTWPVPPDFNACSRARPPFHLTPAGLPACLPLPACFCARPRAWVVLDGPVEPTWVENLHMLLENGWHDSASEASAESFVCALPPKGCALSQFLIHVEENCCSLFSPTPSPLPAPYHTILHDLTTTRRAMPTDAAWARPQSQSSVPSRAARGTTTAPPARCTCATGRRWCWRRPRMC